TASFPWDNDHSSASIVISQRCLNPSASISTWLRLRHPGSAAYPKGTIVQPFDAAVRRSANAMLFDVIPVEIQTQAGQLGDNDVAVVVERVRNRVQVGSFERMVEARAKQSALVVE